MTDKQETSHAFARSRSNAGLEDSKHDLQHLEAICKMLMIIAWCAVTYGLGKLLSLFIGDLAMYWAGMAYLAALHKIMSSNGLITSGAQKPDQVTD